VGTIRKLKYIMIRGVLIKSNAKDLPTIKFSDSCRTTGKEKPKKVNQKVLEDTQLNLMHQVHNKKHKSVETRVSKSGVECILEVMSDIIQESESIDIL